MTSRLGYAECGGRWSQAGRAGSSSPRPEIVRQEGGFPCPTIGSPPFDRSRNARRRELVAAIFADIKRTKNIDFVPALWRTIATNPALLELVWTNLKTLMHPEAVGRDRAARPQDPRDHRSGRLGHQRLPVLHQLAHGRLAQAGRRSGNPRRGDGHRRAVQHDQLPGQRLPDRARRAAPHRLSLEIEWRPTESLGWRAPEQERTAVPYHAMAENRR